jgi:hypothetical protein
VQVATVAKKGDDKIERNKNTPGSDEGGRDETKLHTIQK